MTGKHYNWHKRWNVNVKAATATHDSGLIARFLPLPIIGENEHEADSAIGKCWTPDGREWGIVASRDLLHSVFDALAGEHGARNAQQMIARLAREAGETWVWHKSREN